MQKQIRIVSGTSHSVHRAVYLGRVRSALGGGSALGGRGVCLGSGSAPPY